MRGQNFISWIRRRAPSVVTRVQQSMSWSPGIMRVLLAAFVLIMTGECRASEAIVTDGDTLILKNIIYRLDGIDAPQTDQVCIDEKGKVWACGIEAREKLKMFIAKRDVQCTSKRSDLAYRNRRTGVCMIEGESISLNQWLVREGWALSFGPEARKRFKADQDEARDKHKGLWKGCFSSPRALRNREKNEAVFLGSACPNDKTQQLSDILFPMNPVMPEGCTIKGKLAMRAHLTGHRGIYHLEGCKSYPRLKTPDRWFCSEHEALAEGFRPSLTCGSRNN